MTDDLIQNPAVDRETARTMLATLAMGANEIATTPAETEETILTDRDFDLYVKQTGSGFVLRVQEESGTVKILWRREEVLAYAESLGLAVRHVAAPPGLTEEEIFARYKRSAFAVREVTSGQGGTGYEGSGWVYKRFPNARGGWTYHVVTNCHVADEAGYAERPFQLVDAEGRVWRNVRLVGADPLADVAVLVFDTDENLTLCPLAEAAAPPQAGERWLVLGNTKTGGVIPLAVEIEIPEGGMDNYTQTNSDNAPFVCYDVRGNIRPGNSGSAAFDATGAVRGMYYAYNSGQNAHHIIPADVIRASYENIVAHRDRHGVEYGDWGLYTAAVSPLDPLRLAWQGVAANEGVLVHKIYPGEPAARADIRPGDVIVAARRVDEAEERVFTVRDEDGMHTFLSYMLGSDPQSDYVLRIYRPQENVFITRTIRPQAQFYGPLDAMETDFGFNVVDVSLFERRTFGLEGGVKVVDRRLRGMDYKQKTAQKAWWISASLPGLRDGMLITAVNGTHTPTAQVFRQVFMAALKSGDPIKIRFQATALSYYSEDGGIGSVYEEVLRVR